jgi:hypothetical protein
MSNLTPGHRRDRFRARGHLEVFAADLRQLAAEIAADALDHSQAVERLEYIAFTMDAIREEFFEDDSWTDDAPDWGDSEGDSS